MSFKKRKKKYGFGSKLEKEVYDILRQIFPMETIHKQHPIGKRMFLDFFIPTYKLAVEVDGSQHSEFNSFFHKTQGDFDAQQIRDRNKHIKCQEAGIFLVRISEEELKELRKGVNEDSVKFIMERIRNEIIEQ